MDEMRLGLIPNYRRCWGVKGERVIVPYAVKYEWSWLWLSVSVAEGELEAMWTPCVGQDLAESFLEQLRQACPDSFVIVVWDGSGWHKVRNVPDGILLVPLPAYSPELNPVENLNGVLRGETANAYLDDLDRKENLVDQKLKDYWEDPEALVQLAFHPWIRKQWSQIQKLFKNCHN